MIKFILIFIFSISLSSSLYSNDIEILQEEIPITKKNTWGLITNPGLGVVVDDDKLKFFHQKFLENGEYKLYGDRFPI